LPPPRLKVLPDAPGNHAAAALCSAYGSVAVLLPPPAEGGMRKRIVLHPSDRDTFKHSQTEFP
jgi:hypothetical protein